MGLDGAGIVPRVGTRLSSRLRDWGPGGALLVVVVRRWAGRCCVQRMEGPQAVCAIIVLISFILIIQSAIVGSCRGLRREGGGW